MIGLLVGTFTGAAIGACFMGLPGAILGATVNTILAGVLFTGGE